MNSRLYEGWVEHHRRRPHVHRFRYRVFQMYLDLSELDTVFAGRWLWSAKGPALAWFRRADHLGEPTRALDACVRDLIATETGARARGPIRLLTHLRYFGYCFNPVSFYYCFDRDDQRLEFVVAEVNNTPWGERHCYVLDCRPHRGPEPYDFSFHKNFHISPFMAMSQVYRWRFRTPGEEIRVIMENHEAEQHVFSATARLEARPVNARALAGALARHPFMTGKVIAAIYWQALRLWRKRVPVHPHPAHGEPKELNP